MKSIEQILNLRCPKCGQKATAHVSVQQFHSYIECNSCGYLRGGFEEFTTLVEIWIDECNKAKGENK